MKRLAGCILFLLSINLFAEVNQQDIAPLIDNMVKTGQITATQGVQVKEKMQTMNTNDWQKIEKQATDYIKRNPSSADQIKAGEDPFKVLHFEKFQEMQK